MNERACATLQLDDVFAGEAVRIDWASALKVGAKVRLSTVEGKSLIHLGKEPLLYPRYLAALFNPSAPWVS